MEEKNMKKKITKEMKIGEVLRNYPETIDVFSSYGLRCACCPMAEPETLEEATGVHEIDLDGFLSDLNDSVK